MDSGRLRVAGPRGRVRRRGRRSMLSGNSSAAAATRGRNVHGTRAGLASADREAGWVSPRRAAASRQSSSRWSGASCPYPCRVDMPSIRMSCGATAGRLPVRIPRTQADPAVSEAPREPGEGATAQVENVRKNRLANDHHRGTFVDTAIHFECWRCDASGRLGRSDLVRDWSPRDS